MKKIIFFLILALNIYSENLNKALELIKSENYEDAKKILEKIIEKENDYVYAYTNLGFVYYKLGEFDKSIEAYQKSYQLSPSFESKLGLAWSHLEKSEFEKSKKYSLEALEMYPENYLANLAFVESNYRSKNYKDALIGFKNMENFYGKNEVLSYKIAICEKELGNEEKSEQLIEEIYNSEPKDKDIRYLLGLSPKIPNYKFNLDYGNFSFQKSDIIGYGYRKGAGFEIEINDWFKFGGNFHQSKSNNKTNRNGLENYFLDGYNLLQYSLYNFNTNLISNYYGFIGNRYNLYNIVKEKDFQINYFDLKTDFKFAYNQKLKLQYFSANGNNDFLKNANALKLAYEYGLVYKFGIGLSSIYNPNHSGGQLDINFYFPFLKYFYSYSNISFQSLQKKETEYLLISVLPVTTVKYTNKFNYMSTYFIQEIGFSSSYFFSGLGVKVGEATTPVVGDSWIYTPFRIQNGAYIFIGKNLFENCTMKLEYSKDTWVDSLDKKVYSDFTKFQFSMRF